MLDKLKNKAQSAQEKVSEVVGAIQVKGGEELARLSASVEEVAPVLEGLGYRVMGARITLGLPPSAAIGIAGLSRPVDPAAFDAAIADNEGSRPVVSVLRALRHITGVHAKVRIKGLAADMAEITLGAPPSVSLMFERSSGAAFEGRRGEGGEGG